MRKGLTGVFLFGLPSALTETERAMSLVAAALLGRRETGTGRPVRLSSRSPAPWNEELLRLLFMLEQTEGPWKQHRRSEGSGSASSLTLLAASYKRWCKEP